MWRTTGPWRECAAVWRAAWPWSLLIAAELVVRLLFDTFAPPSPNGYGPRSVVTTYAAIGTFVLVGFVAAARNRSLWYGPPVAFVAGLVGHVIGIAATLLLYFTVIVNDATKLTTFDMTGGFDETVGFTLVAPVVGTLLGLIGGVIGMVIVRVPPFSRVGRARVIP
jgi:hypothetical protein